MQTTASEGYRLSTWVTVRERQQVDAVVEHARIMHRGTLDEVGLDLLRGHADGVLVSVAQVTRDSLLPLRGLVAGFPGLTIVGLIGGAQETDILNGSYLLGQAGVQTLADVRRGWGALRTIFDGRDRSARFLRDALSTVLRDLGETVADGQRFDAQRLGRDEFFRHVFFSGVTTARELAHRLEIVPATMMSRFFRAGLPSPKHYVSYARLVRVAHLGESSGLSLAAIADAVNASSPQSFHRTIRLAMGMSAAQFRYRFTGASMLERFRADLVTPHRHLWSTFDLRADPLVAIRRGAQ